MKTIKKNENLSLYKKNPNKKKAFLNSSDHRPVSIWESMLYQTKFSKNDINKLRQAWGGMIHGRLSSEEVCRADESVALFEIERRKKIGKFIDYYEIDLRNEDDKEYIGMLFALPTWRGCFKNLRKDTNRMREWRSRVRSSFNRKPHKRSEEDKKEKSLGMMRTKKYIGNSPETRKKVSDRMNKIGTTIAQWRNEERNKDRVKEHDEKISVAALARVEKQKAQKVGIYGYIERETKEQKKSRGGKATVSLHKYWADKKKDQSFMDAHGKKVSEGRMKAKEARAIKMEEEELKKMEVKGL